MEDLKIDTYILEASREFKIKIIKEYLSPILEIPKVIIEEERKDRESILMFKNIKEFENYIAISNILNTRRKLRKLLNANNDEDVYRKILNAIDSIDSKLVGIVEVSNHDYKVLKDFDITKFPFAKFYDNEYDRYLTSGVVIGLDISTGFVNMSIHRLTPIDKNHLVIRLVPRHLYSIWCRNRDLGKDTPIAIVWTINPVFLLAAACSPPFGYPELNLIEKFVGFPVKVFFDDYEIPIPVDAEIVMIGKLLKEGQHIEGPYADILRLYDDVRMQPIIEIEKVYIQNWRNRTFVHYLVPGLGEHRILMSIEKEAKIWKYVSNVVPKVKAVRLTPGGGSWLHAVISISKNTDGDAKNAIIAAFAAHPSLKHVVVVDDDIDVDDPEQVEWAIATRFRADEDLVIIRNVRGSTLDPSCIDQSTGLTVKVGIDATKPLKNSHKFEIVKNSVHVEYSYEELSNVDSIDWF